MAERSRLSTATAVVAGLGAGAAIVGAHSPWFHFSLLNVTAHIKGTYPSLHGTTAARLGDAGVAVAIVAVVIRQERIRRYLLGVLAVLGIVGVAVMQHQARYLNTSAKARIRDTGFGLFKQYLGQRTVTAWGFWLDVGAFAVLVLAPLGCLVLLWIYSRRSAPPSTGITQPVTYDAAGDSANAAT